MNQTSPRKRVTQTDVSEIIIGSLVLALPVAVTEEVWNLSTELSLARVLLILLISLCAISFFVQTRYRHEFTFSSQKQLFIRVITVYGLTLLVSTVILLAIDRLPVLSEPIVALKRLVIVSFAASFAATVVDSLGD